MTSAQKKPNQDNYPRNSSHPWKVMLYDDERLNITDVAYHLQLTIATSNSQAVQLALAAHKNGEIAVFQGSFFDCQEIADDLREHGLTVEIIG
jgi:ATP-dependent Clp protease adapter protein ClpS